MLALFCLGGVTPIATPTLTSVYDTRGTVPTACAPVQGGPSSVPPVLRRMRVIAGRNGVAVANGAVRSMDDHLPAT